MQSLISNLRRKLVGNKAKGLISKRVFQKNKARQIFHKKTISYPLIRIRTCAYQGVRNVFFSENLACFVFLKHPFWDSPFCLITDELSYLKIFGQNFSEAILINEMSSFDIVKNISSFVSKMAYLGIFRL